jgi:hypothetical protein
MPTDDTSTSSYRVERGEPEVPDPTAEQSELSLGAMARGALGDEGGAASADERPESGSPGADSDRSEAARRRADA